MWPPVLFFSMAKPTFIILHSWPFSGFDALFLQSLKPPFLPYPIYFSFDPSVKFAKFIKFRSVIVVFCRSLRPSILPHFN